jgi:hypothetical protein
LFHVLVERLVNDNPSPPPVFSEVLILKGDEVVCFDTVLQVLILKVDTRAHRDRRKAEQKRRQRITHPSRLGVKRRRGRGAVAEIPHPRYFGKKGCKLLKTKNGDRKKRGKRF